MGIARFGAFVILAIFVILVVTATVSYVFKGLSSICDDETEAGIKYVPMSERIDSCEAGGGRYGYYYSDIHEKYIESCTTPEVRIRNF